jgi:hypothetical protein
LQTTFLNSHNQQLSGPCNGHLENTAISGPANCADYAQFGSMLVFGFARAHCGYFVSSKDCWQELQRIERRVHGGGGRDVAVASARQPAACMENPAEQSRLRP